MKLQPDPTGSDNLYMVTHLSVSVAKCDGDDEALEAVEDYVKVFVSGLPLAVRVFLRPEVIKGLMNVTRNPARTLNIMGDAIAIVFLPAAKHAGLWIIIGRCLSSSLQSSQGSVYRPEKHGIIGN